MAVDSFNSSSPEASTWAREALSRTTDQCKAIAESYQVQSGWRGPLHLSNLEDVVSNLRLEYCYSESKNSPVSHSFDAV